MDVPDLDGISLLFFMDGDGSCGRTNLGLKVTTRKNLVAALASHRTVNDIFLPVSNCLDVYHNMCLPLEVREDLLYFL